MKRAYVVSAMIAMGSAACALPHAGLREDGGAMADIVSRPDAVVPDGMSQPDVVEDVACPMGFVRCGGSCVNTQTDVGHCGGCGMACPMNQECSAGACRPICAAPRQICGGSCVDTTSDALNCGACGMTCPMGQVCRSSACAVDCGALTMCGTACVDPQTSAIHCGRCNNACPMAQTCTGGMCRCPTASQTFCDPACVDMQTDNNHCGMCGRRCMGGQTCVTGACQCPAGQHLCGAMCVANTSTMSCGATSCTPCMAPANGTATCNGTTCGFTCNAGFVASGSTCVCAAGTHLCGATCVSNTSTMSCGTTSCMPCTAPMNGTATCDGTTCGFTCNPGFAPSGGMCVPTCPAGQHLCGGTCVMNTSTMSCGTTSCTPCVPPANGTSTCNGTTCGFTCNMGFMPSGGTCVATAAPCGNGTIDMGETCDDRNAASGDGCSMTCQIESAYVTELCNPAPSFFPLGMGQTIRLATTTAGAGATGGGCSAAGPELVYAVRTSVAGRVTIRLVPNGWNAVLKAGNGMSNCANDCVNAAGAGVAETTAYDVGANTVVWAVVDGVSAGDSGSFTLDFAMVP